MGDIVCISHLRWDFVWQRPQHLLSRFAKHHRVLFVEEPMAAPGENLVRLEIFPGKGAKNVTVARLVQPTDMERWIGHGDPLTHELYDRLLGDYLQAHGYVDPILWLYTPMASDFTQTINHRLLIVDVMDQLSAFKGAPLELIEREEALLHQANIVFTGGASLYRAKLPFNEHTYLFPSGVEVEHFAQAAQRDRFPIPDDMRALKQPILGYFGVIDERMDLDLLHKVAQARPEWNLALLGPVVKIDPADLPQAPNMHYLGMKSYEQLPAYLAHFDVALVPFALNEATRFLSPTKTLEYMAAHKPIVSTPIRDVIDLYGSVVRVAINAEEFIAHIEAALAEDSASRLKDEDKLLGENTWDNIARRMNQIIEGAASSAHIDAAA